MKERDCLCYVLPLAIGTAQDEIDQYLLEHGTSEVTPEIQRLFHDMDAIADKLWQRLDGPCPSCPRVRFEGDNRLCGRPTKSGKPCRAHALMGEGGEIIGCYLHDHRRLTHRQMSERP